MIPHLVVTPWAIVGPGVVAALLILACCVLETRRHVRTQQVRERQRSQLCALHGTPVHQPAAPVTAGDIVEAKRKNRSVNLHPPHGFRPLTAEEKHILELAAKVENDRKARYKEITGLEPTGDFHVPSRKER